MSSVVSGASGSAQSWYESRMQASVIRRQMEGIAHEEQEILDQIAHEQKAILGEEKTLYAKAGVDITSGSPLAVMADTAGKEQFKRERVKWATKENLKAKMFEKHVVKHAGDAASSAQGIGAGVTLLEMIAGSIAGGMSGAGFMGGVSGFFNPSKGFGSLLNSMSSKGTSIPSYGLAGPSFQTSSRTSGAF